MPSRNTFEIMHCRGSYTEYTQNVGAEMTENFSCDYSLYLDMHILSRALVLDASFVHPFIHSFYLVPWF